ncbi:MAG: Fic family protein [Cyclonatronaceae bacterium]
MNRYNWQQPNWPDFTYSLDALEEKLLIFTEKAGLLSGIVKSLPDDAHLETILHLMLEEAINTSEIEGEFFSREEVLSSIQRNLGITPGATEKGDKNAMGVGKLMTMVRESYHEPLTGQTLFDWHRTLLPDSDWINVGAYRTNESPMQVVSGAIGKQTIHFEAPPSHLVPQEMKTYITWFNSSRVQGASGIKLAPVRSAIAHLYFESIHPFEDGNGRIGRAIAEKALSQGLGRPVLLSLSDAIQTRKKAYYTQLEYAQRTTEITDWITWFTDLVLEAQHRAEIQIDFTLGKVRFFDRFEGILNERQLKVIRRMFEFGPDGFEGGMNARKYIAIAKTSKATATRDLQNLLDIGAFVHYGTAGGRSTRYQVDL